MDKIMMDLHRIKLKIDILNKSIERYNDKMKKKLRNEMIIPIKEIHKKYKEDDK